MKKLCVIFTALILLSLSLVSCRNYDTRDGRYDYYNDPAFYDTRERSTVGEKIDRGINRTERGIRNGFDRAENGFEDVTGLDTDIK